ncbi:hypothetical protein CDCA_CDCA19G4711 [Cyanidium caldarium]|uniref:RRM domain-containing protein n=1 Tax=Cyanidium caldarium TaxID=2771 RepID=A0AAV9J2S5_CYACA|nr:hypothetical protein CDCA_CDCA19G4711 [Cyanidium caldarium]
MEGVVRTGGFQRTSGAGGVQKSRRRRVERGNNNVAAANSTAAADDRPVNVSVGNLHPQVTSKDVADLFNSVGPTIAAFVRYDHEGRSKGTATVKYRDVRVARKAVQQFNGVPLDGQPMAVRMEPERTPGRKAVAASVHARLGPMRAVATAAAPSGSRRAAARPSTTVSVSPPQATGKGGLKIVASRDGARSVVALQSNKSSRRRRTRSGAAVAGDADVEMREDGTKMSAPGRRRRSRRRNRTDPSKSATVSGEKMAATATRPPAATAAAASAKPPPRSAADLDRELDEYRMAD